MQSDQIGLSRGLLFGSDSGFSQELRVLTKSAGITHLVAASGANLRFVQELWSRPFQPLGFFFLQYSSLLGVALYWFLAEQSGSLWRAILMWSVAWLARQKGQRMRTVWSLGICLVITGVWQAERLSPGFWLSTLAILGLFFSQKIRSGENKRAIFPQSKLWGNKVVLSLFEGWLIFLLVSIWLWTQYQVFQPIGILSTLLLGLLVDPLVWLGFGHYVSSLLSWEPVSFLFLHMQSPFFSLFWSFLKQLASWGEQWNAAWLFFVFSAISSVYIYRWGQRTQLQRVWSKWEV